MAESFGLRFDTLSDAVRSELKRQTKRPRNIKAQEQALGNACTAITKMRLLGNGWPQDIQCLIYEIDKLLSPWWTYFKAKGSWGADEQKVIEAALKSAEAKDLDKVIRELEKVCYKMGVEARQKQIEPPEKSGKPRNRATRKRKAPTQFLKDARERNAVKELAKNPNMTCVELAKILECDKSTVVRLKAWKERVVLGCEPPKGIVTRQEDDSYTVDGVARTELEE